MPAIGVKAITAALPDKPGAYFLKIEAKVYPKFLVKSRVDKTPFPYDGQDLYKEVHAVGMLGADYEKSVNRALVKQGKEPDFVAGEHQWAVYKDKAVVVNADATKSYLRFIEKSRKEFWFLNGQPVSDPSVFDQYLPVKKDDEPVKYRNFTIGSDEENYKGSCILSITCGEYYLLDHTQ